MEAALISFTDQRERLSKLQEALEEAYPSHYTRSQHTITVGTNHMNDQTINIGLS